MTLAQIQAELYRRLNFSSTPATGITTRLTGHINLTHRQILTSPGLQRLRDDEPPLTFASVNGQSNYALPPVINRIESITDRTTQIKLRAIDQADITDRDPGLVQTGPPWGYVNKGWQQVATQPSAATGLWAASSSASDLQQCFVETIRTGGYRRVEAAVNLTGASRVQLGSLTDHIEVVKFYVSTAAVGAISLYDAAAAGNELARIPIGGTYARYLAVQLYPTPSSAITYYVECTRTIADMANSTDEPLLPEDFHYLLVEGSLLKEWTVVDDTRRVDAERAYNKGMSDLKYFVNGGIDFMPLQRRAERSRFGANYPATRY